MTRVLIAEREESIASLLRTLLADTFDLVLLDIGLHSDGLETLTRITGRNHRREVIALTTGPIKAPLVYRGAGDDPARE